MLRDPELSRFTYGESATILGAEGVVSNDPTLPVAVFPARSVASI